VTRCGQQEAVLSVTDEHVLTGVKAAESHGDPFDRLLLSVGEAENVVLLTADTARMALGRQEPRLPSGTRNKFPNRAPSGTRSRPAST